IRKPDEFFNTIAADAVDEDELAMMQQIIKRKTRNFDPGKFTDHYQAAVRELIEKKLEGKLPEKAPERKQAQVINLMDALKRSLAQEEKSGGAARRRTASRTEREPAKAKSAARGKKAAAHSGQRNLWLPVTQVYPESVGMGVGFSVMVGANFEQTKKRLEQKIGKPLNKCEPPSDNMRTCELTIGPKKTFCSWQRKAPRARRPCSAAIIS